MVQDYLDTMDIYLDTREVTFKKNSGYTRTYEIDVISFDKIFGVAGSTAKVTVYYQGEYYTLEELADAGIFLEDVI